MLQVEQKGLVGIIFLVKELWDLITGRIECWKRIRVLKAILDMGLNMAISSYCMLIKHL